MSSSVRPSGRAPLFFLNHHHHPHSFLPTATTPDFNLLPPAQFSTILSANIRHYGGWMKNLASLRAPLGVLMALMRSIRSRRN
ncbi:leucine-rich repeat-containing protein 68-like [Moniliophthora roreri]|nr:leucine-rich repeat-containing protein 68-like [Moniliophthora roreri]